MPLYSVYYEFWKTKTTEAKGAFRVKKNIVKKLEKRKRKIAKRAKTSCHRFSATEARLKMGFLAYNLLHLIRRSYVRSEKARRSIEWRIPRLVKVGAIIAYHARYWHVHIASAFGLQHHYRAVFGLQHCADVLLEGVANSRQDRNA
jgi:hypothetical protein